MDDEAPGGTWTASNNNRKGAHGPANGLAIRDAQAPKLGFHLRVGGGMGGIEDGALPRVRWSASGHGCWRNPQRVRYPLSTSAATTREVVGSDWAEMFSDGG